MKSLGGQAIVEGVMIKSSDSYSLAVRLPNGKIKTRKKKYVSLAKKHKMLGFPFLRGIIQLWEMLVIGLKALTWSANEQGDDEKLGPFEWFLTFSLAIVLTIGLFVFLPYYGARFVLSPSSAGFGLFEGVIRLVIFILYLAVIGIGKDIKRMFQYHGAEHMAVHCYERNESLTVQNVKKYPPEPPRCGTSLLFFVIIVSILLFSLVRNSHWYYNIIFRIILIPFVAGISYELLKLTSRYGSMRWLTYPGILVQKLTTRRPTKKQIEVAIAAVERVR